MGKIWKIDCVCIGELLYSGKQMCKNIDDYMDYSMEKLKAGAHCLDIWRPREDLNLRPPV